MALNGALGLGVNLSARDAASPILLGFGKNLSQTNAMAQNAASGLSSAAMTIGKSAIVAGTAWIGGLGFIANISGEFNEAIATVGAVSGASAKDLLALKQAALEAGIATQFSPKQAAVGLGDLAQAGYSARESIDLLRPVLDLAAGSLGKLTPSGAAGLAAQTLKAFQIPTEDAADVVDKLLQSVNAFALSAEELPMALGTASRGAQAMKQNLDETLISLGLVKNIIPGVERASTAVAVAMEKMVQPKTAGFLAAIGVKVADAKGKFRPFLDVLQDMQPQLAKMTDQKQAGFLEHAFGAEALGGIQAIMTQVGGGIKTTTGEIVKGAAAIKYLREQFYNASGTAKTFSDALLNTYAGQKKLLKGSLETLAIVAGEPLEKAFRPMVEKMIGLVNRVIAIIQKLPESVKVSAAKFAILAGAVLPVIGGLILAAMAVSMFAAKLAAMGGAIAVLGPVALAIAVLTGAVATFKIAYEENIGGFGKFIAKSAAQAKLGFDALVQVFRDGGFSGAVMNELGKAENDGLKSFVIDVYVTVNRVRKFFSSMADGFRDGLKRAWPVFEQFKTSLAGLAAAFGVVSVNTSANGDAFDAAGINGRNMGDKLAAAATIAVDLAGKLIDITVALKPLASAFMDIATWSMESGFAIDLARDALIAVAAVKVAEGMAVAASAIKAIGAAAAAANVPLLPFTAAIAAVALAVDQFLKLWKELGDSGLGDMWAKFKFDIGVDSQSQYERNLGIRTGENYDEAEKERRNKNGVTPMPAPVPLPQPGPLASVAVASQQNKSEDRLAGVLGSIASMPVQVNSQSTVRLEVDGEVLASVVERHKVESSVRDGLPAVSY